MGKIKICKDTDGNKYYPVTIGDAVVVDGETLTAKIKGIQESPSIIVLSDNESTTAGDWKAKSDLVKELVDGQLYLYRVAVAGASTTYLTINSLAKKTIYRTASTKLTTNYAVGEWLLMTYNATKGAFNTVNDYDANSYAYVRQYVATDDVEYPLLHMYDTTKASAGSYVTKYSRYTDGVTVNPINKTLTADNLYAKKNVSAGGYATTSDMTKKDVIKDIKLALDDIANAPAFAYRLKGQENVQVGTSAQYWKGVLPESVSGEEGNMMLSYGQLAMTAIISLANEVRELKTEIRIIKQIIGG